MTVTIPRWALIVGGVVAVAVIAFLIGRGSGGDNSSGGEASGSLDCNEEEMNKVLSDGAFTDAVLDLDAVPVDRELLDVWQANLVDCVDLTEDGAEEMVIQLVCCTASSPWPWAIFEQVDERWTPSVIRTRIPSGEITIEDAVITETHGTFADGDPRCCPSGKRQGTVSWNGSQFVFKPETGTTDRTIALADDTPETIGGLPVQTANLSAAIDQFGIPSDYLRSSETCRADWRDIGLLINFVNLGGENPCEEQGAVGSVVIGGHEAELAGWQTPEGATIGMTEEELLDLYPEAKPSQLDTGAEPDFAGRLFELVSRPSVIGEGGTVPSLSARLDFGAVTAFELYVGAGGE